MKSHARVSPTANVPQEERPPRLVLLQGGRPGTEVPDVHAPAPSCGGQDDADQAPLRGVTPTAAHSGLEQEPSTSTGDELCGAAAYRFSMISRWLALRGSTDGRLRVPS